MVQFDLSLSELQQYRTTATPPDDLDRFWAETLAEALAAARPTTAVRIETPLRHIAAYDVTFTGYAGQPIRAWLNLPADAVGPLPGVVEFIGYGGGRGQPWEWLFWASAGYAHLVMDTRGQGGSWSARRHA